MGRYAQQRKRGGHVGTEAGLPPGPGNGLFALGSSSGQSFVSWIVDDEFPFSWWRSRWRVPALSMLWTLSGDDVQVTATDSNQYSPFAAVAGQQQDCEIIYCDVAGNPRSQWSAFKSVVP
jgi:hypothetical protein